MDLIRCVEKVLKDEKGRDFAIKSISIGNWLNLEGYMWGFEGDCADRQSRIENLFLALVGSENANAFWKEYHKHFVTEEDIKLISKIGFNTIKIPLHRKLFIDPSTGDADTKYAFSLLDEIIEICKRNKVYVVLDLHSAPGGQTGSNIDDSSSTIPELFSSTHYQESTAAIWTMIAQRYKDEPTILAYDLLNEPLSNSEGKRYLEKLEPLLLMLTEKIRQHDLHHIVSIQGPADMYDWSMFGAPFDNNLLYQFHYFDSSATKHSIQSYLDFRDRYNVPIWCGGMGENVNAVYAKVFGLLQTNTIGYSFWSWKKNGVPNNPLSIRNSDAWKKIQSFVAGEKLDKQEGRRALDDILESILLKNCIVNSEVIDTIF